MNIFIMTMISITAGCAIALQSSMSGQLGAILKNPLLATLVIYLIGCMLLGPYILLSKGPFPPIQTLESVPKHLWIAGSLLSTLALSTVYWQMPQIGVAKVMTGLLLGQLITSLLAAHFGWFNLPIMSLTKQRIIGTIFLVIAIILINGKTYDIFK